jgi:hypothetical protein
VEHGTASEDVALRSAHPVWRALWNLTLSATSAFGSFALVSSPGCGTDAIGVEDCRDIERARCAAAAHCGVIDDVGECQRFYRDHCLHGLPTAAPDRVQVEQCVATIETLGECAARGGGTEAEFSDCPGVTAIDPTLSTCEVILSPQRAHACSFLTGKPVEPSGGGQGGQGGSSD